jgi:hypothetical protein
METNSPQMEPKNALGVSFSVASRVGDLLKTTRMSQNESRTFFAQKIKVREQYLKAMEEGQWDELPPGLSGRGIVRIYARELGLDLSSFDPKLTSHSTEKVPSTVRSAERRGETSSSPKTHTTFRKPKLISYSEEDDTSVLGIVTPDVAKVLGLDNLYLEDPAHREMQRIQDMSKVTPSIEKSEELVPVAADSSPIPVVKVEIEVETKELPAPLPAESSVSESTASPLPVDNVYSMQGFINKKSPLETPSAEPSLAREVENGAADTAALVPKEDLSPKASRPVADHPPSASLFPVKSKQAKREDLDQQKVEIKEPPASPKLGYILGAVALLGGALGSYFLVHSGGPEEVGTTNHSTTDTSSDSSKSNPPNRQLDSKSPESVNLAKEKGEISSAQLAEESSKSQGTSSAGLPTAAGTAALPSSGEVTDQAKVEEVQNPKSSPESNPAFYNGKAVLSVTGEVTLQATADGKLVLSGSYDVGEYPVDYKSTLELLVYDGSKVNLKVGSWNHGPLGHSGRKRKLILNAKGI